MAVLKQALAPAKSKAGKGSLAGAQPSSSHSEPILHPFVATTTYLSFVILTIFGRIRDILSYFWKGGLREVTGAETRAPLLSGFDSFYTRRFYRRSECRRF